MSSRKEGLHRVNAELLDQLGIATAHFAGRGSADLKGFLSQHPEHPRDVVKFKTSTAILS